MKRFIDLRGQGTGSRFAWWNTVRSEFESWNDSEAWGDWEEFKADFLYEVYCDHADDPPDIERYMRLCPEWAFHPDPDDEQLHKSPQLSVGVSQSPGYFNAPVHFKISDASNGDPYCIDIVASQNGAELERWKNCPLDINHPDVPQWLRDFQETGDED